MSNSQTIASQKSEDRRYLPRWEVSNKALYRFSSGTATHECQSRDVHFAGACICTKEYIPLNQKLKLTIYLTNETSIEVDGTVLWQKPMGQQYLIGVNFYDVSRKVQETILKYAFEIKKEDLIRHWFRGWDKKP